MKEIELVAKRKAREKHFLQPDGTIVAKLYDTDIHYLKDGKYEEIDNTLIEDGDFYTNKSNDYKIYFSKKSSDSLMNLKKENHYLNIQLKQAKETKMSKKKSISKLIEEVSYDNIYDGIDIEYKTLPEKVKETIVLHHNQVDNMTFMVDTDLTLELEKGYIIAKEGDNLIFTIEKPYMEDANGVRNDNIYYELIEDNDKYGIKLILDKEWLASENTKYPIYIDPTILVPNTEKGVYDTYIYPGDTDVDRNSRDILKVGVEEVSGQYVTNRTLIKFDLPELGTSSEIIEATLWLIGYPTSPSQAAAVFDKTLAVHRVTTNWNETTANWNNMSENYDKDRIESVVIVNNNWIEEDGTATARYSYAYLTGLVKQWYTGTPNNGIMLKLPEEVYIPGPLPRFFSKNNKVQNSNPQPTLEIIYRDHNGLESYLNYKTQSMTNGATYVNTFNGNLTGIWNIGSTVGGRFPANVNLVYNSNDVILNNNTIYGKGYKLSYDQTLEEKEVYERDCIEYIDEDGTIHYFYKDSTSNPVFYYDEDGLNLKIERQENSYIMTDKSNNEMLFVKNGLLAYLSEIRDVNNNKVIIGRNSNNVITTITDAEGAKIELSYELNKIKVVSPDCITEIGYTNKITNINSYLGTVSISYNENDMIDTITDVNGLKFKYTYYSQKPYRIQKVTQYGLNNTIGEYFSLEYETSSTRITDNLGRVEALIFNSYGNLVTRNSLSSGEDIGNAYSISGEYGDENQNKNRFLSKVIPIKYIKNYFKNSSFETDTKIYTQTNGIQHSYSTDYAVSGNRSLKLLSTQTNQSVIIAVPSQPPKGRYYTFSGYFKNDQPIEISLEYNDTSIQSVNDTIKIENSDDFVRHDISLYYPENASDGISIRILLPKNNTTVYVDNIQFEEGEVANNYNILENSDFSNGLSNWELEAKKFPYTINSDGTTDDILLPTEEYFEVVKFNNDQNTALKVKMNPLNRTSFSTEIPVKGKKGDFYQISFWYKNEGISLDGPMIGNTVYMYYIPADGRAPEYCIPGSDSFPVGKNIWQYSSFGIPADYDYTGLKIIFNQGRDANDFYITNLTLYSDISNNYFEYDSNGNITCSGNSENQTNVFDYNKNNRLISMTTPKGKNFKYEYDIEDTSRVLSALSPMGISNKIIHDSFGNPITTRIMKTRNSEIETGFYTIRLQGTNKYLKIIDGKIALVSNPCSKTIFRVIRSPERGQDEYKIVCPYNNRSLRIKNHKLEIFTEDENYPFRYGYAPDVFKILEDKDGSNYIEVFDDGREEGVLIVENGQLIFTDNYADSSKGHFYFEMVEQEFIENNATYTEDGRFIESVTDSNFNKTLYETDPVTGLVTSMTNANGITTTYAYNSKKQITTISQGDREVNYTYNNNNLLSKITQENREYNFSYDEFLKPKTISIGNQITLVTNDYKENNGNLLKTTYGNNHEISYEYDRFDRIETIHKMDGDYHYKYDSNGNLAKILKNNSIIKYGYDLIKRVTEYNNNNFKINYKYDLDDKITNKKYSLDNNIHSVVNDFDQDDMLIKLSLDNDEINYEYDSLGRLLNKNINNNYQVVYDYISTGKRTSDLIKNIQNGTDKYTYKYDKLNNITHLYYNDELQKQYYYDEYNELIKEEDYQNNVKIEYNYDNLGNLLTKSKTNLETNVIIKTDTYQYSNSDWIDQLTNFNGSSITYDEIGNPITIGNSIILNWINGRSLSSYSDSSKGLNISYQYNVNGIRTSKVVNAVETKYYLENSNIIYEKRGTDTLYYLYDKNGILGLKYNNDVYYYIKNLQEDIIGILDSSYNRIVSYEYDSWGKVLSVKDQEGNEITNPNHIGIMNPFRYRSYYYDEETKLYYLNSRYYNPEWGRFLNSDSTLGTNGDYIGYNLYSYVSNNPINNSDPTGMFLKKAYQWVKKKANQVYKKATKIISDVADTAINIGNSIKKAFVFEAEVGFGVGAEVNLGPINFGASASKTIGYGYSNSSSYQYTSNSASFGISANVSGKKYEVGFSGELRNYDNGQGNPMAMPWEVWNDENTAKEITVFGHNLLKDNDNSSLTFGGESSKNSKFIGISFEGFIGIGGKIKIGFNIGG